MSDGDDTYSRRIERRYRLWWGPPRPGGRSLRDAFHRLRERRVYRSRDDPDADWRCCPFWPRTLINKWNGREFAIKHGCAVPELYWSGPPSDAPIDRLPDRFVVRSVFGTARRGVLVVDAGRDLLRGGAAEPRTMFARSPRILIEEFVRSEDGSYALPIECKCHVFGKEVAAIEVIERSGASEAKERFYTSGWEPFEQLMSDDLPLADVRPRPPGLDRMVEVAATLGGALGTYMRIDFFATEHGFVFNEFSSTPGLGAGLTPYADAMFGARWAALLADAI